MSVHGGKCATIDELHVRGDPMPVVRCAALCVSIDSSRVVVRPPLMVYNLTPRRLYVSMFGDSVPVSALFPGKVAHFYELDWAAGGEYDIHGVMQAYALK